MREQKYSKELGGTAGCSMRLIEASHYSGSLEEQRQEAKKIKKRGKYYGDSWFTDRRLGTSLYEKHGHEYFGALKTNHSRTPKEEAGKLMEGWPAGSYLVLECEELRLFFIGYKYNYNKKGNLIVSELVTSTTHDIKLTVLYSCSVQSASSLVLGTVDQPHLASPALQSGLMSLAT